MLGQGGPSTGSWRRARQCRGLGRSRALRWLSSSPRFIAEPQPCAKPSLSLPPRRAAQPRQVWPPLRASAAMEPAASHWLPRELFMLQLAPNTLVYEEKPPGTTQHSLHLPSSGRPRPAALRWHFSQHPQHRPGSARHRSPAPTARTAPAPHNTDTPGPGQQRPPPTSAQANSRKINTMTRAETQAPHETLACAPTGLTPACPCHCMFLHTYVHGHVQVRNLLPLV